MATAGTEPAARGSAFRERTVLAWNRSALAAVVCIGVILRHIWPIHGAAQYLALGLVAGAAILWAIALLMLARSSPDQEGNLLLGRRAFGLLTASTLMLAFIGLVLALAPPPSS
jgi:uncharacterized membrane protein YidH (DUF202 family)